MKNRPGSKKKRMSVRDRVLSLVQSVVPAKKGDPAFEIVTQGRQHGRYSACGDLINYVLQQIGAPTDAWNRDDTTRGVAWRSGENISKPVSWAKRVGAWVPFRENGPLPKPGDLVLIGRYPDEAEHVFVLLGINGYQWMSGDYGQTNATASVRERVLDGNQLNGRTVVGWIDVEKVSRV